MKYKVRRGSVGRPLVIKKLKRPEGTITIRSKRIREHKIAKDIINMINDGKGYDQIAKDLGLTKKEVLIINQKNTLRHGNNVNRTNIIDMMNLGITTKEISEIFNCKESYVISILKNINYSKNLDIEREINFAIKVRDLLEKYFNFNYISYELKLSKYKLFKIYNKYFEKYNDEVIDFDTIDKFLNLKLNYDDIAKFYNIPKEYLMELIKMNEKSKLERDKNKIKEEKFIKDEEDILTKSYKASNIDFHARKYNK
nr:hypothetical protein [uncultured Romboutsia sp.]